MELVDRLREERPSSPDEAFDILKRESCRCRECSASRSVENCRSSPRCGPPTELHRSVSLVVGVNGVGKTTGIRQELRTSTQVDGHHVVMRGRHKSSRPVPAEQLRTWGRRLDVDVISHREGADPGAVAFDAVSAALSR
ncbi:Signal recognition particle receptor FtsY [Geodia barretti]|uniref:Signal recognition particle receptor FtsY n=1 Tax=Geodia barretti TaxID=519541 RepID=A0AA35WER0_GEOBA|nr:Signal recognition particle receptor FtsY [Geodia barretti]